MLEHNLVPGINTVKYFISKHETHYCEIFINNYISEYGWDDIYLHALWVFILALNNRDLIKKFKDHKIAGFDEAINFIDSI